jgi:16S rRNA processing protein RimM
LRDKLLVGIVTGAHGIRGEVKLKSFTADPEAIAGYNPLETGSGKPVEIAKLRPRKDGFIAILKGVGDRNAAEALKGTELFVPRARLPETAEDEVYVHDLIGLTVLLRDGSPIGKVVNVPNYGAGDLLEVKVEGRENTVLIPFASRFLIEKKFDAGKMVIELPEGFLEEAPDQDLKEACPSKPPY